MHIYQKLISNLKNGLDMNTLETRTFKQSMAYFGEEIWNNEEGKRVLLWKEQGIGET